MSQSILYRAADEPNPEVWGRYVEAATFDDDAVPAKLDAGWSRHPQDIPDDARATAPAPKPSKKAADA